MDGHAAVRKGRKPTLRSEARLGVLAPKFNIVSMPPGGSISYRRSVSYNLVVHLYSV